MQGEARDSAGLGGVNIERVAAELEGAGYRCVPTNASIAYTMSTVYKGNDVAKTPIPAARSTRRTGNCWSTELSDGTRRAYGGHTVNSRQFSRQTRYRTHSKCRCAVYTRIRR